MQTAAPIEPLVVHSLPGRVRFRVGCRDALSAQAVEARLLAIPGVHDARANALTGNVLVLFDPATTEQGTIRATITAVHEDAAAGEGRDPVGERGRRALPVEDTLGPTAESFSPHVVAEGRGAAVALFGALGFGTVQRAHVTVHGLDRDAAVGQRVVEALQRLPGLRAYANPLTGRVVVEFRDQRTTLDQVRETVARLEDPASGKSARPSHPLDLAPLLQGAGRLAAAFLGLAFLAGRRAMGEGSLPSSLAAARAAGVISVVQGFPATRNGVRRLLGRNVADATVAGANIVVLALSGNPLGVTLAGAEALRLVTEVAARRRTWRSYEERIQELPPATAGSTIRLDSGDRAPLTGTVVDGMATALGRDGLPVPAGVGTRLRAGDRIYGGPLLVHLEGEPAFASPRQPPPNRETLLDRYSDRICSAALAFGGLLAVVTGSPAGLLTGLALVNARVALIGAEAVATGAAARVLRAGVTVVGTRPEREIRRPDVLLLDGARVLTDGLEAASVVPMSDGYDATSVLNLAAGVAAASGTPWGGVFRATQDVDVQNGSFDGRTAQAFFNGVRFTLGPASAGASHELPHPASRGSLALALQRDGDREPLAVFAVRPRLAPGALALLRLARRQGVEVVLVGPGGSDSARSIARRLDLPAVAEGDLLATVRARQADGAVVAVLSDSAAAGAAFGAADLAIGLSSGQSSRFAARADLLAPDLTAVAAIIAAGGRAASGTLDAVRLSLFANGAGALWGLTGRPSFERASLIVTGTALVAMADGWARLRGGQRPRSTLAHVVDPRPERWGRQTVEQALHALRSTPTGLAAVEAEARRRAVLPGFERSTWRSAIFSQLRMPINVVLLAGAGVSAAFGSPVDMLLIVATLGLGVTVGAWQERRAEEAAAALGRLTSATATVLRDGQAAQVGAGDVVPGDILLLAPGDRVTADARLLVAHNLEVDEAALTGESLPVAKSPEALTDAGRVVLEGSDITVGTARALVVAVGRGTRLGATAASLALEQEEDSPLASRLSRILNQVLPVAAIGGGIVVGAGLLRGQAFLTQVALGTSVAIAAVPEGLPLLSGVGQAAVARRLAGRHALVRRLGAVEALGRVDIACADKTGTLTVGKPAVTMLATLEDEFVPGDRSGRTLTDPWRTILRTAGLASPHPESAGMAAHPTDLAVIAAAERMGMGRALRAARTAEAPFDPARAFHASHTGGRIQVKGATEAVLPRCSRQRTGGKSVPLPEDERERWHRRAEELAARGLRVLMVAAGPDETAVNSPYGLTALGFVGISDPLREDVTAAVHRCRTAGIRVIMLTGDHPATAVAIARAAGIVDDGPARLADGAVLSGRDLADLEDADIDRAMARATIIARVTPLDKLRVVESLQRCGHTVAMTGDGVNDAPALRLADVGVAMGLGGTEVARQAADVVLADDNFTTLAEALVEGRSFWRNIRRALSLLLGGNLGELGLVVGAVVVGLPAPLVTRQILAVNLITDALPALAVAIQPPADRSLTGLAREGEQSLDRPLRDEVLRRGAISAVPALAAFTIALRDGLPAARAVALATIVSTQLAQTLEAGRGESGLHRAVAAAVAGSGGVLLAALTVSPLRGLLAIGAPTPLSWLLIGTATASAVVITRVLPGSGESSPAQAALPAMQSRPMLPPRSPGPEGAGTLSSVPD